MVESKECDCDKWKRNESKIVGIFIMAAIHHATYDGELYDYCGWCGKALSVAADAPREG